MSGSVNRAPDRAQKPTQKSPKPLSALHDVELAQLATAGDRNAFVELVKRHGAAVRTLLRRLGAEPGLADRLAQDAFILAFETIADFRGEGVFVGWVQRIAARLYLKRGRNDKSAASTVDSYRASGLDLGLADLSATERLFIGLCYGADFSLAEVAAATATPVDEVRSQIRSGMDTLRRRLGAASAKAYDGQGAASGSEMGLNG